MVLTYFVTPLFRTLLFLHLLSLFEIPEGTGLDTGFYEVGAFKPNYLRLLTARERECDMVLFKIRASIALCQKHPSLDLSLNDGLIDL